MPAPGMQFPVVPGTRWQQPIASSRPARSATRSVAGGYWLLAIPRSRGIRSHSIAEYESRSPQFEIRFASV